MGTTIEVIQGDTKSLDYSSHGGVGGYWSMRCRSTWKALGNYVYTGVVYCTT